MVKMEMATIAKLLTLEDRSSRELLVEDKNKVDNSTTSMFIQCHKKVLYERHI